MISLYQRKFQVLIDLLVLSLALGLAFLIRFDWTISLAIFKRLMFLLPYVVLLQYTVLIVFGVPRFSWRFVGLRESIRILYALAAAALLLLAIRLAAVPAMRLLPQATYAVIPIGVIMIDFLLAFMGVTGVRALRRVLAERSESSLRPPAQAGKVKTLLIGAGQAGVMVAKEIIARPDLGIEPVGFVDDDPRKKGTEIHGLRVLGSTAEMPDLCAELGVAQALITIANAPGRQIRRIVQLCEAAAIPTKIIPGIYEIVGGQVNLSRIREVSIEDLLGREQVSLDMAAIASVVAGRHILVTGAGGSIGSELCRQLARFSPGRLILLDQAETPLFFIHRELGECGPGCALDPIVADICDQQTMERLFATQRIDVIFHAAAYKHVPVMEANPAEAIKNNVFGTRLLADLAHAHQVKTFVMISTDKAVNPSSVMGVSKRVAEMYIQALSQASATTFVAVRFGNVLGSTGSVIPLFKEQIARGGPVTVTHPDMQRYFMTIPEACQLVLQAGAMGRGGEIFILDMGQPVKIVDLARDLIRLSGFKPDEDIEIVYSGVRPGEKLFETLSVAAEHADSTVHPKVFVGRLTPVPLDQLRASLGDLDAAAATRDPAAIRAAFARLVPEYRADAA